MNHYDGAQTVNASSGKELTIKAKGLGGEYKTELEEGIRLSYEDFLSNPVRAER